MRINLNYELRNLDGVVLLDQDKKSLTLRAIFIQALLDPEQSRSLSGEEKLERHDFAVEIKSTKSHYDFNDNNVKKLKDLVGKIFTPLIVGQVWPILDKGHHPLTDKNGGKNGNKQGKD